MPWGTATANRVSGTPTVKRALGTAIVKGASGPALVKRASGTAVVTCFLGDGYSEVCLEDRLQCFGRLLR